VKTSDLIQFARRDWNSLADLKAAHWKDVGAAEALRVGDELRRFAQRQHPGWPSEEERRLDLETHVRVTTALHRAGLRGSF
jgi:hypothetical protein